MPFTFAHPAIVLPLARLNQRWLSLTGLVIGSLTPDFEYFLRLKVAADYSHTLWGILYFDLPLGFLLLLVYNRWVKIPLVANLPEYFNKRFLAFAAQRSFTVGYVLVIVISLIIGVASHLFWDSFTHPHRYFVNLLHLEEMVEIGPIHKPVFKLLQHGSTFAGFTVIGLCIHKLPKQASNQNRLMLPYWLTVAGVAGLLLIIKVILCQPIPPIGDLIVTSISGVLQG